MGTPNSAGNDAKEVNKIRKKVAEDPVSAIEAELDGIIFARFSISDLKIIFKDFHSEKALYESNTGQMVAEKNTANNKQWHYQAQLLFEKIEEKLWIGREIAELLATELMGLKIMVNALTLDFI